MIFPRSRSLPAHRTGLSAFALAAAICMGLGFAPLGVGADPDKKPAAPASTAESPVSGKPETRVTKTGEHSYRLGKISFDAKAREIRMPAVVNFREGGPVEYLLVHENGKVHESILSTSARPLHLQIVLKLLRYGTGEGTLFDTFLPEEEQRRKIERRNLDVDGDGKADGKVKLGDSLTVSVAWKKDGKDHERPLAEWVLDAETNQAMTDEPWILTGSIVENGEFLAEIEGSIIAVYLDQLALFNMSRKGADNDERWGANADLTPEIGQKVTVIFRSVKKKKKRKK